MCPHVKPKITGTTTITIQAKGPILPGSISSTKSQCGKPNCARRTSPAKLHGTYYRWTGFIAGQRTTKTISKQQAEDMRAQDQELSGSAAQTRPDRRGRPGQCALESVPLTSGHSTDFTPSMW